MGRSGPVALPFLLWLLLSIPGCANIIGIDESYTDHVAGAAGQGGTAGNGESGHAGSSGESGGSSSEGGKGGQEVTAECSGVLSESVCWHLGNLGDSCNDACAARGGVAPDVASFVGTAAQGGSLAKCATILRALGENPAPSSATRSDGKGLGCHSYQAKTYWLASPEFSGNARLNSARVVCGCQH